jgi:hypothetical protein
VDNVWEQRELEARKTPIWWQNPRRSIYTLLGCQN